MSFIVYTDLDGTLLDHQNYSYDAAMPALKLLRERAIAIVPVTSKTRAELKGLRQKLQLNSPFIVENGAAVFIPRQKNEICEHTDLHTHGSYFIKEFSPSIQYWSSVTAELSRLVPGAFRSFLQMTVSDVAELTGLSLDTAEKALQREYSDPIYWCGNDEQYRQLLAFCAERSIDVVRGGRFVHLLKGSNKGQAVSWLHQYLNHQAETPLASIVAGDGENDLTMLAVADYPIQVKSASFDFPEFNHPSLTRTHRCGPAGWSDAITAIVGQNI